MSNGNIVDLLSADLPGNGNIADKIMTSLTQGGGVSVSGSGSGLSNAAVQAAFGLSSQPLAGKLGVYTDTVGAATYLVISDGTTWWSLAANQLS